MAWCSFGQRILHVVDAASRWCVIALMALMVTIVSTQVLLRYGLSQSFDWAPEFSRLCFVWVVFMAIPHAVGRGRHVSIDLLVKLLPDTVAHILFRMICIACALLMSMVAIEALQVARTGWDQMMATVDISSGWFYVALAVCGIHSCAHFLVSAVAGMPGVAALAVEDAA